MKCKTIVVRAAANFAGANTQTGSINVKGAKQVAFMCTATNAQALSVGTIQTSNDGTNWIAVSTAATNGKALVFGEAANGVAMNAGPVRAVFAAAGASIGELSYIMEEYARFNYTAVAQVDNLQIVAEVYYEQGGADLVVGDANQGIVR